MGNKGNDFHAAFGCSACHVALEISITLKSGKNISSGFAAFSGHKPIGSRRVF
ncbi:hypothetical protein IB024_13645 [Brucella sp. 6810]|nr:hypothetical protein IB024_13645 [Brucella sp. 6810]